MRTPIDETDDLSWYRAAIAGGRPQVTDDPHVGWYKRRLVKGGPEVPVRIWRHQEICQETGELLGDSYLCCEVDGKPADPEEQWLWCCMQPIPEQEYAYLLRLSRYAKRHDQREPLAAPRKPVDLNVIPPPTFEKKRRRRQ